MKKAFSLVELLVVIAIIAVLMGVILGTFSGGTESARAAKCLSNLRNLAAACQSYGVESYHYPAAGSFEWVKVYLDDGAKARREYSECGGWISWNSQNAYLKDKDGKGPSSHQASGGWNVSAYSPDEDARMYCLTNGVLWKYVNCNHDVYICPLHAQEKKTERPNWSYAMNAYFRWDHTRGSRPMPLDDSDKILRDYGREKRADRRLLFAEIPFMSDSPGLDGSDSPEKSDSVLQYAGCLGCGTPEIIGFNHKSGKRNRYAHVVFADGHTEKLLEPAEAKDEDLQKLTRWLCEGIDISFDGRKYRNLTKDEDEDND